MNDPAAQRVTRLTAFHTPTPKAASAPPESITTVLPPARYRPVVMASATSAKRPGEGRESASTKTSHDPTAAAAAALRAREIWFTGSKTTRAPWARAMAAVPSLELLSQTISSLVQPRDSNTAVAFWMLVSVAPRPPASL